MIYLCSVYSLNADEELMEKRWQYVMKRTAEILKEGIAVFSPIAHSHEIAKRYNLPKEFDFWKELDFQYLAHCDLVWVLRMPGWNLSKGITAELEEARRLGKRIVFIECEDYSE